MEWVSVEDQMPRTQQTVLVAYTTHRGKQAVTIGWHTPAKTLESGNFESEIDDEYDEDEDDDEEYFETTCPVCEEEIVFDEDTLESGEIRCPNCGEKLEFDLSDLADAEDEDEE